MGELKWIVILQQAFFSPSTVTVNSKGGLDTRALVQLLSSYIERLYPDGRDQVGYHVM